MRIGLVLIAVAVTGCATEAPAPKPTVTREVKIDNKNVEEVQRAGYKIVNKDGVKLFCRTDTPTGTRVQTRTTCLTEREMQEQQEALREGMERMDKIPQGPKGT
jgi:carboxypeptidase C (cathepsin A)